MNRLTHDPKIPDPASQQPPGIAPVGRTYAWRTRRSVGPHRSVRRASRSATGERLRPADRDYLVLVALTGRPDGRVRLNKLARDHGWEPAQVSPGT